MPEYIYICVCKNEITVVEPMVVTSHPTCPICDGGMWRKPQMPAINWNGLRPSQGDLPPAIQQHVNHVDQIREETDEFYYERDKNKPD